MRLNVLTLGQRVRICVGKHAGKVGRIKKIQLYADWKHVYYEYRVKFNGGFGRTYGANYLEVV